jgi:hypothetical protein
MALVTKPTNALFNKKARFIGSPGNSKYYLYYPIKVYDILVNIVLTISLPLFKKAPI